MEPFSEWASGKVGAQFEKWAVRNVPFFLRLGPFLGSKRHGILEIQKTFQKTSGSTRNTAMTELGPTDLGPDRVRPLPSQAQTELGPDRVRPDGVGEWGVVCVLLCGVCVCGVCGVCCVWSRWPPFRRTAQNFAFFFPSPASISLFFCLSGCLLVSFFLSLGVFLCLFFSLWVSSRVFFSLSGPTAFALPNTCCLKHAFFGLCFSLEEACTLQNASIFAKCPLPHPSLIFRLCFQPFAGRWKNRPGGAFSNFEKRTRASGPCGDQGAPISGRQVLSVSV